MKVKVNGNKMDINEGCILIDLLRLLNVKPEVTIVEINEDIIDKLFYNSIILKENDQIELIRFMGGGI